MWFPVLLLSIRFFMLALPNMLCSAYWPSPMRMLASSIPKLTYVLTLQLLCCRPSDTAPLVGCTGGLHSLLGGGARLFASPINGGRAASGTCHFQPFYGPWPSWRGGWGALTSLQDGASGATFNRCTLTGFGLWPGARVAEHPAYCPT